MDRQVTFKRIARVLAVITIVFLVAYTVFGFTILYSELKNYVNTHEVNMSQFYFNLRAFLALLAVFSLILGVMFSFRMTRKNKVRKTAILTALIFYLIILGILFEATSYEYSYFPFILIGLGFGILICQLLSIIPKGYLPKAICKIKNKRNGE